MTTTVTASIDAAPDDVFATLTHAAGLPAWNRAIRRLVQAPPVLTDGAEWVVELHVLGRTWRSRSRVQSLDPQRRTFTYRSRTDDGNASYADWSWTVTPASDGGSVVTVGFDLHPRTFWRRVLFVHVRRNMLRSKEIPNSMAALSAASKGSLASG